MEQIRRSGLPPRDDDEPAAPPPPPAAQTQTQTQMIDDILDQIDEVLEDSSAAFVRGFVQKGGQ
ncbi:MAG: ubiquitin-like protein Pup [Bifidobacteriaceae bacterium]|jgi:ubiquitin-like protein Pup|nr:ubiquitin-like protein Pup [Bifidobacteriaceae bacterium]